jgi:hypothetical protein
MARYMSRVTLGVGQTVNPTSPVGETYDIAANAVNVDGPNVTKSMSDATTMEDDVMVYLSDVPDAGAYVISGYMDSDDTALAAMEGDADLQARRRFFQLTQTDPSDDSTIRTVTVLGEVQEFSISNPRGDKWSFSASVKLSGLPARA